MPVIYNSHSIIPGPFLEITKRFARGEDGGLRRKSFGLALKGSMLAYAGSPRSDGSWWDAGAATPPPDEVVHADARLAALRSKIGALQALFGDSGKLLEVQPWDGSASIKANPRVESVEFAPGKWVDKVDFTVNMEADNVYFGGVSGGGGLAGVEPEESWSVEVASESSRSYRVSHTVSSQQRASYDAAGNVVAQGWENARAVVTPYVGLTPPLAVLPPQAQSGYLGGNYTRSQVADHGQGRYTVTENWVYVHGQRYTDEFTVDCRVTGGMPRVSVRGTVTGFADPDPSLDPPAWQSQRYARAQAGYAAADLLARAQNYSGFALNPSPLSTSVARNPAGGSLSYEAEYDARRGSSVAGAISEKLTVANQNPTDIFASLVVLGRPAGPVLQPVGTKTARVRTATIEVVMPPWKFGQGQPSAPNVFGVLMAHYPGGFVSKDDDSWSPDEGRYSRSISWTYE